MERDGLFDVTVHKTIDENDLKPETVFACDVAIPGTKYSVRRETMYFPGKGGLLFIVIIVIYLKVLKICLFSILSGVHTSFFSELRITNVHTFEQLS